MKTMKISTFIVFALLASTSNVLADGMMLSAPEYYIDETSQQAVIQYDQDSSTEKINILPGFRGDAMEFAWILPMPALPAVEAGDQDLFRQLRDFTRPKTHYRDGDWDGCNRSVYSPDYATGDDVTIVDSQIVGYYQIMTLDSDNAPALMDSLTQWGFLHSENIDQATDLINSYVEQDWYFVTVKVDSTTFAESYPDYQEYHYYGGFLEPLEFTFSSTEMIYPMRISAMSAAESTQVDLFVITDHRTTFDGATTRYANRFNTAEISSISSYYQLVKNILEPDDFLTHLRRDYRPQDMTEDLIITQAPNNDEFLLIYYSGFPWMTLLFFGPAVLWGLYRKFFRKEAATIRI